MAELTTTSTTPTMKDDDEASSVKSEGTSHADGDDSKPDSSLSLVEENERLRSQLLEMKEELSRLQQDSSGPPLSLRAVAQRKGSRNSWKWLNAFKRSPREKEALSDDGSDSLFADRQTGHREMVELPPGPSPTGLHHRHVPGSPRFKPLPQTDELHIPSLKAKMSDIELAENGNDHGDQTERLTRNENDDASQVSIIEQEDETFRKVLQDRATWLVGLLVLQSCSSFIIKNNQEMLSHHIVIVRFLTMLVGAGGNAGNQASVRVIRGLAIGTVNNETVRPYLHEEMRMGLCLSAILGVAGAVRAAIFLTPLAETLAITSSLVMIVAISILLGALLPLGMKHVNIDPAHSSTTIQVLMDILGVTITVYISGWILDSSFGAMLDAK